MEEFLIYLLVLGGLATFFVPLVYNVGGKFLPSTVTPNVLVPTSYPTTLSGILWNVLLWGTLLYVGVWLVSKIGPVGRAISKEA